MCSIREGVDKEYYDIPLELGQHGLKLVDHTNQLCLGSQQRLVLRVSVEGTSMTTRLNMVTLGPKYCFQTWIGQVTNQYYLSQNQVKLRFQLDNFLVLSKV